jgi:hypothetical protein
MKPLCSLLSRQKSRLNRNEVVPVVVPDPGGECRSRDGVVANVHPTSEAT